MPVDIPMLIEHKGVMERKRQIHLAPASNVIASLGGACSVARDLGLDPSVVLRWMYPAEVRGSGGHIPRRHFEPLMNLAKQRGVPLRMADFYEQRADAAE